MDAFDHIIPEGECCKSPISLKSQSTRSSTFHDSLSSHTSCTLSEDNVFDSKNNRGKPCSPTAEGPESLCPSLPLSESLSQRFLIQGRRDSAYWNIRSSGRNKDEALLASLRWVPEKERDEIIMRDADGRIRAVVRNDALYQQFVISPRRKDEADLPIVPPSAYTEPQRSSGLRSWFANRRKQSFSLRELLPFPTIQVRPGPNGGNHFSLRTPGEARGFFVDGIISAKMKHGFTVKETSTYLLEPRNAARITCRNDEERELCVYPTVDPGLMICLVAILYHVLLQGHAV